MSRLPVISGRECVKVLDRGTLRAIMRQGGLNVEEFLRHL